jgi:hypothetical protein
LTQGGRGRYHPNGYAPAPAMPVGRAASSQMRAHTDRELVLMLTAVMPTTAFTAQVTVCSRSTTRPWSSRANDTFASLTRSITGAYPWSTGKNMIPYRRTVSVAGTDCQEDRRVGLTSGCRPGIHRADRSARHFSPSPEFISTRVVHRRRALICGPPAQLTRRQTSRRAFREGRQTCLFSVDELARLW